MSASERDRRRGGAALLEPWRPGTLERELLALRARVWGADHPHTSRAFFGWLFGDDNPAGAGGGVLLRRGERVLGFMGLCPRRARVDGKDVVVAQCLDYMVDRSLGPAGSARYALRVAAGWAKWARSEDYAFGIGFPNRNSYRIVTSPRLGWRDILHPRLMARPLRGAGGGGRGKAAQRLGLSLGGAVLEIPQGLRRRPPGKARPLRLGSAADAAAIDALWRRRRDDARAAIVRDAAQLGWRYARHPVRSYDVLGWQDGDELSALLVTTKRDLSGLAAAVIVDAVTDPEAPAAARALIAAALRRAARDGAAMAVAEAEPGGALARALADAGFVTVPRRLDPKPFTLVGLPLAAPAPGAFRGPWHFAWGDMDVV